MADIREFKHPVADAAPAPKDPHMHGKAKCLACGHNWHGVAPVGADEPLVCSACGAQKGVFLNFVKYAVPTWHCEHCNGFLFTLVLAEATPCVACATCGTLRNAIDLWNE